MGRKYHRYTKEEKIQYIQACRQSGLSDFEWCTRNNIPQSTFYNWIVKLRKESCTCNTIPSDDSVSPPAINRDIVRINVAEPQIPVVTTIDSSPGLELVINNCNIKIYNNASSELIVNTLNALRGALC